MNVQTALRGSELNRDAPLETIMETDLALGDVQQPPPYGEHPA